MASLKLNANLVSQRKIGFQDQDPPFWGGSILCFQGKPHCFWERTRCGLRVAWSSLETTRMESDEMKRWFFCLIFVWAVLSDEQMSNGWPFSLLNDEQMSNWLGVEHQPVMRRCLYFEMIWNQNWPVSIEIPKSLGRYCRNRPRWWVVDVQGLCIALLRARW